MYISPLSFSAYKCLPLNSSVFISSPPSRSHKMIQFALPGGNFTVYETV